MEKLDYVEKSNVRGRRCIGCRRRRVWVDGVRRERGRFVVDNGRGFEFDVGDGIGLEQLDGDRRVVDGGIVDVGCVVGGRGFEQHERRFVVVHFGWRKQLVHW